MKSKMDICFCKVKVSLQYCHVDQIYCIISIIKSFQLITFEQLIKTVVSYCQIYIYSFMIDHAKHVPYHFSSTVIYMIV